MCPKQLKNINLNIQCLNKTYYNQVHKYTINLLGMNQNLRRLRKNEFLVFTLEDLVWMNTTLELERLKNEGFKC